MLNNSLQKTAPAKHLTVDEEHWNLDFLKDDLSLRFRLPGCDLGFIWILYIFIYICISIYLYNIYISISISIYIYIYIYRERERVQNAERLGGNVCGAAAINDHLEGSGGELSVPGRASRPYNPLKRPLIGLAMGMRGPNSPSWSGLSRHACAP